MVRNSVLAIGILCAACRPIPEPAQAPGVESRLVPGTNAVEDSAIACELMADGHHTTAPCLDDGWIRHPPIRFDDEHALTDDDRATVSALADFLQAHPDLRVIEVQGHHASSAEHHY